MRNADPPSVTYPWALIFLVCAVYLPLFRSGITVFGGHPAFWESWLSPEASRAVNVLTHALCSVLVYQVGRRLLHGTAVALWAAVLFAVHPVHVDAIARVPGSAGLVAALLPLGLVLLVFLLRDSAGQAFRTVSILSAAVLWLALTGLVTDQEVSHGVPNNPSLAEPVATRLLTGVYVLGRYLKLLVWPFRLTPDYSYNSIPAVISTVSVDFLVPLACILVLLGLAVLRVRQHPFYLVSCVFLLICAFPVWGLARPLLGEKWLYFPSVAFCWSAALLFRDSGLLARVFDWHDRKSVNSTVLLAVFLLLPWSAKTYIRSKQWQDEKVLLQQAVVTAPNNAYVELLLGNYRAGQGDYPGAQRSYRRALEIMPTYTEAGLKLVAAYRQTGMYSAALQTSERLIPGLPRQSALRAAEVARTYVAMDDFAGAARAFEESLKYFEGDASVHRELGMLYLHFLGQPERGRDHLRRSLEIDSAQPAAAAIRELLARP